MTTDGPPGPFFGALEAVTSAGITGWAFRAGADAPLRLTLRFDDLPPLDLPCDRARPDLWAWRPDLHAACRHGPRIGFATPVPPPLHNGKPHRLVLSDEAGNILPLTLPGASPGQPVTFTLPAADLLGHVARDGTRVVGWAIAIDPATGERRGSNEVRIADADGTILTVTAADDRPDVARLLGAPPNCGFDVLLPAAARGVLLVTIGPDAADLPGSPLPALPPAVKPSPDTDPDDPRFAFSALPRRALFGITRQLDAISRAIPADAPIDPAAYPDEPQRSIAPVFDRGFYLDSYPDVRAHGIDPVTHFCASGWRELRWPAPWFDTGFYLDDNPDVRDAGINPFRHYLNSGRQEGRPARRPGGHRPQVIAALIAPEARMAGARQPPAGDRLTQGQLLVALNTLCADAKGLIASVSHDHYRDAIGGVQLCVDIEQRAFTRLGWAYLHLSPLDPDLILFDDGSREAVRIILDGRLLGHVSYGELAATLRQACLPPPSARLFVVHCLFGHDLAHLACLHQALLPRANYFWVHDYSALCTAQTLLRNDVAFCAAPEAGSDACRVCIHGDARPEHLARLGRFFAAIPFHVVAPSQPALRIWQAGTTLPYLDAVVHPHCRVEATALREAPLDLAAGPVRVAFVGLPTAVKGWPIFRELVYRTGSLGAYRFYHFVSPDGAPAPIPRVAQVLVTSTATQDAAMRDALAAHDIDIVMALSHWPETFSYMTFEAMAAGAELVALESSGNIADVVLRQGRGIVARDEAAIYALFESLRIVEYLRQRRRQGISAGRLVHGGTTATLPGALPPASDA